MNIVAIGSEAFIPGFGLAGVSSVAATPKTVMTAIQTRKDAAVIILDEELFLQMTSSEQALLETSIQPIIIVMTHDPETANERIERIIISTIGVHPHALVMRDSTRGDLA